MLPRKSSTTPLYGQTPGQNDISETGSGDGEDPDTGCGQGAGFVRSFVAGDRIAIMAGAQVKSLVAI